MSDIGLNLDGVVAFLAAGALCLFLLLALGVCSLFTRSAVRRPAALPHRVGILVSLAGGVVILIVVVVTALQSEGRLEPNRVGIWLDERVLLWIPALLALWPIGALLYRRRCRLAGRGT